MEKIIQLPIFVTRENDWFVACCPILDIATQGESENEAKENMKELIQEYMSDPDTYKPPLDVIISSSVTMTAIPVKIDYAPKTSATASA